MYVLERICTFQGRSWWTVWRQHFMLPPQWMTDAGGESAGRGSPLCSGSSETTDVGGESVAAVHHYALDPVEQPTSAVNRWATVRAVPPGICGNPRMVYSPVWSLAGMVGRLRWSSCIHKNVILSRMLPLRCESARLADRPGRPQPALTVPTVMCHESAREMPAASISGCHRPL